MSSDYKTEFLSLIHSQSFSDRMYSLLSGYTPSELITVHSWYNAVDKKNMEYEGVRSIPAALDVSDSDWNLFGVLMAMLYQGLNVLSTIRPR
jgi:hypothetical protein